MLKYFFLFLFINTLFAKNLTSPIDAMKATYGKESIISKGKIHLTNEKFKKIQLKTKTKLNTKNYIIYRAKKDGKILGYGLLINKKIHLKNNVILYLISKGKLKNIEIITYNESQKYIFSKKWQAIFKDKNTNELLQLTQNLPTTTKTTLFTNSIIEGSRLAFALYNEIIEGN